MPMSKVYSEEFFSEVMRQRIIQQYEELVPNSVTLQSGKKASKKKKASYTAG